VAQKAVAVWRAPTIVRRQAIRFWPDEQRLIGTFGACLNIGGIVMIASAAKLEQGSIFVRVTTVLLSALTFLTGMAALLVPKAFAEFVHFPLSEHFVHDAGAFEVGIGATLATSLFWRDGYVVALSGFLVANTVHMINHIVDQHLGGSTWDPWGLGMISILTATALIARIRQSWLPS
jgi:hypothetical protein